MNTCRSFDDGFIILKESIPLALIEDLKLSALSLLGYPQNACIDLLSLLENLEKTDSSGFYAFSKRLGESVAATKIALLPRKKCDFSCRNGFTKTF